jgi:hypothetical protein
VPCCVPSREILVDATVKQHVTADRQAGDDGDGGDAKKIELPAVAVEEKDVVSPSPAPVTPTTPAPAPATPATPAPAPASAPAAPTAAATAAAEEEKEATAGTLATMDGEKDGASAEGKEVLEEAEVDVMTMAAQAEAKYQAEKTTKDPSALPDLDGDGASAAEAAGAGSLALAALGDAAAEGASSAGGELPDPFAATPGDEPRATTAAAATAATRSAPAVPQAANARPDPLTPYVSGGTTEDGRRKKLLPTPGARRRHGSAHAGDGKSPAPVPKKTLCVDGGRHLW